jgi:hypothetical protein
MADEDQPHAALRHEVVEDRQHLHLHRDVERGGRLVGDQQVRLRRQHHGDHDALSHAARDLVRMESRHALRVADAHGLQHLQRAARRRRRGTAAVHADRLGDLFADPHHRVQRILRILQHERDAPSAQPAQGARIRPQQVHPVEGETLRGAVRLRRQQPHQRAPGERLAGT